MTERPLLWSGIVVAMVGLAFNLGLFFVPLGVWLDDPGFVSMPEALLGWWVMGIGVVLMVLGRRRRSRR